MFPLLVKIFFFFQIRGMEKISFTTLLLNLVIKSQYYSLSGVKCWIKMCSKIDIWICDFSNLQTDSRQQFCKKTKLICFPKIPYYSNHQYRPTKNELLKKKLMPLFAVLVLFLPNKKAQFDWIKKQLYREISFFVIVISCFFLWNISLSC